MNLSLISEIWDLLAYYIDSNDRSAAATTMVDFLIDNDYSAKEIKSAFVGEKEVLKALEAYDDAEYSDDEDEYDEDDSYNDDDW